MHELAVCQALIEQVERVARDNAARRILSITVSRRAVVGRRAASCSNTPIRSRLPARWRSTQSWWS